MKKFRANVATEDELHEALIYCQNELRANRALDGPKDDEPPLTYTLNGQSFDGDDDDKEDDEDTSAPTTAPNDASTDAPTTAPTNAPTNAPTDAPTGFPTFSPTAFPSESPTSAPTVSHSESPTAVPTESPIESPTESPTASPTESLSPTAIPTDSPTAFPTFHPTTFCVDSTDFQYKNTMKKNCNWVPKGRSNKVKNKCKRKEDGIKVWDWCPETCGEIAGLGRCAFLKD